VVTANGQLTVRAAVEGNVSQIVAIAQATGQDEDWDVVYPAYVAHVMARGRLLVAERDGTVIGFGGTLRIGAGRLAVSMLTDLFVDPAAHGAGTGRAILGALWQDEPRRITFASLHAHALPLYTSFGLDAWWPLLYLSGDLRRLAMPNGWSVSAAEVSQVGIVEREWTGIDRTADHQMWAARPNGSGVVASLDGQPMAAGTIGGVGAEYGISHLAINPAAGDDAAAAAVIAVLSWLDPPDGRAHQCLPAPHPAVRSLLASGWRVDELDLHMASEFGLVDPRKGVPSPALA